MLYRNQYRHIQLRCKYHALFHVCAHLLLALPSDLDVWSMAMAVIFKYHYMHVLILQCDNRICDAVDMTDKSIGCPKNDTIKTAPVGVWLIKKTQLKNHTLTLGRIPD